jgi:hypothetical protein
MSKWADYCISAVRFNATHTHIDTVETRQDNGDTIGKAYHEPRQTVIANLKANYSYVTIFKNREGKWEKGQSVYIIKVHGTEFIKTVDNGKAVDNLDNLPEF